MISLLLVFVLLRPAVSRYYASLEPPGEQNISRASRIIPGNAAYHYVLGQFTFAVHDKPSIDKAIDRYLLSLARNPIDGRTWLALSRAYDDNGDHGAAEYAVRRAAAVDGSNATLSWEAGLFFLLRERFSDAAPFFRKYITIVPADQERVYLMLYALGVDPSYLLDNLVPYDYEHYKQYLRFLMSNNLVPDSIETWKRMADWKLERTDYLAHCNFLIDRGHIDEAREVDLRNKVCIADQAHAALAQGVGKELPGKHGGIHEYRVRHPFGGKLRELAEDDGEDDHGEQRADNAPGNADDCLLVADKHITPGEKVKQLAVPPEVGPVVALGASGFDD